MNYVNESGLVDCNASYLKERASFQTVDTLLSAVHA